MTIPRNSNETGDRISLSDSWSQENAVRYYSSHRNSVIDTYESERFFLSKYIRPGSSILDIGCATGGFIHVFQEYEPTISYTGVDISPEMITQARKLHPGVRFEATDGDRLPFADDSFSIVFISGALHMAPNWRDILSEAWRVTKDFFIFDVRLKEKPPVIEDSTISYEKIAFNGAWDGKTIVPYIVVDVGSFIHEIDTLAPSPFARQFHGYFHPVSEMTVTPQREVCMTMCCLIKSKQGFEVDLWDIPLPRSSRGK